MNKLWSIFADPSHYWASMHESASKLEKVRSTIGWIMLLLGVIAAWPWQFYARIPRFALWFAGGWIFVAMIALAVMVLKRTYHLSQIMFILSPLYIIFWSFPVTRVIIHSSDPWLIVSVLFTGFMWPVAMASDVVFFVIHRKLAHDAKYDGKDEDFDT
jgi:hypothetical protein